MILSNRIIEELIKGDSSIINLNIDNTNQPQWANYVEQYRLVVFLLSQNKSGINDISHPFLFLVRHFTELLLKENLANEDIELVHKHEFRSIYQQYTECNLTIPSKLKEAIASTYSLDNDGSCYRYFNDTSFDNKPIPLSEFFERFQEIENNSYFYRKLTNYEKFNRNTKGLFNCYMREISTAGKLRTQYDTAIERILSLIANSSVDIYDIYLPLMFLLRHSLELALKDNAIDILNLEADPSEKQRLTSKIIGQHSVSKLYNIFNRYFERIPINNIKDEEFKNKLISSMEKVNSLRAVVNLLDKTSRQFRYIPENKSINIDTTMVPSILNLYLNTDSFLTFAIVVLKQDGIIPFTNEELADLYEYLE